MDYKEQIGTLVDAMLSGKDDEAKAAFHAYSVAKTTQLVAEGKMPKGFVPFKKKGADDKDDADEKDDKGDEDKADKKDKPKKGVNPFAKKDDDKKDSKKDDKKDDDKGDE